MNPYIPHKWRIQYRRKGDNRFLYLIKDLFMDKREDVKRWFLSVHTKKHKYYYNGSYSFIVGDKNDLEFINAKEIKNEKKNIK